MLRFLAVLVLIPGFGGGVVAAGVPEAIEKVKPSIVAVGSYQATRAAAFGFRGTGFVVGDGTLVATNAHVLPDVLDAANNEILVIQIPAGGSTAQRRRARTVAHDREHDLALLRIEGPPLPALTLREASRVREGDTVAFTGFPIGSVLGLSPVTHRGMVSSITPIALPSFSAQRLDPKVIQRLRSGSFDVFQLDATAYPGNSGSPVYEIDSGEVIGIINMVFIKGTKEAGISQPSGITFAIPAQFLRELLRDIR